VEGRRKGDWILLDYVDFVVHVFLAERRAFYDIERLRKSARPLTPEEFDAELTTALKEKTRAVRGKAAKSKTVTGRAAKTKKTVKKPVPRQKAVPAKKKRTPAKTVKNKRSRKAN
jgi:ribosome-associated protein